MADSRAVAGIGLVAAGILAAVFSRSAPADETPGDAEPDSPGPTDVSMPVVFGDPEFLIDLVD